MKCSKCGGGAYSLMRNTDLSSAGPYLYGWFNQSSSISGTYKNIKVSLIVLVILAVVVGIYLAYSHLTLSTVSLDDMKYCISDDDCVPVDCRCSCSGCGGFSYDDVVNKKYADAWYYQQGCEPAEKCPQVCCPPRSIACENNQCVVKEGVRKK